MDILLTVFLFIAGFVFTAIGVKRDTIETSHGPFLIAISGFIFIILGILALTTGIETISGSTTIQNQTINNITLITTTLTFTPIEASMGTAVSLIFVFAGVFLLLFSGLKYVRAD